MGRLLIIGFITAATHFVVFDSVAFATQQNDLVDHQPNRSGGPASDGDFINAFGQRRSQQLADEFSLSAAADITTVSAWGFYNLDNPPAIETMRVRFYSARPSDGFPGNVLYEEELTSFSRIATGHVVFVGVDPREFLYTFDLAQPVSLSGGTPYWLEIMQVNDMDTTFRWESSGGGNHVVAFKNTLNPDWTSDIGYDLAFQLIGIPEPTSVAFLTIGAAAIVRRLRRV